MAEFIGLTLIVLAGCGYWLYRENDTGGSWIPSLKDKVNERDVY